MLLLLTSSVSLLRGQDYDPNGQPHEDKGATASEMVSGSSTSISGMVKLDTSIGWNFTKNFGFDVGVPYPVRYPTGDFHRHRQPARVREHPVRGLHVFLWLLQWDCNVLPAVGGGTGGRLRRAALYPALQKVQLRYQPHRRCSVPRAIARASPQARVQWDWFNHIDTDVHGFDPFVNFGLANGRMDQHFLPRPYNTDLPFRTLGYLSDFEGGIQYKAFRRVTVGFSVWDVLPFGPQKIYSNIVWDQADIPIQTVGGGGTGGVSPLGMDKQIIIPVGPSTGTAGTFGYIEGDPNHGRYWNSAFETVGPNYIDRDNGYSATLGFSPFRQMDVLIGYNHSVRYALDGVVVTLAFNANAVFRKLTNY